jgi:hypothetical protein
VRSGWSLSIKAHTKRRRARLRPLHPADRQWFACKPREGKIGCIPQTLSGWVKQAEKDSGMRDGVTTEERDRIKTLERENRELRQANEILRKASAYFAPPLTHA